MSGVIVHHERFNTVKARYGLYVLQSMKDGTVFRIGASGVNGKGDLAGRFKTHRARAIPDGLWTNRHRPWRPIWAVEFRDGDRALTGAAERILYVNLIHHFKAVDVSGFMASPGDVGMIRNLGDASAQLLAEFFDRQRKL